MATVSAQTTREQTVNEAVPVDSDRNREEIESAVTDILEREDSAERDEASASPAEAALEAPASPPLEPSLEPSDEVAASSIKEGLLRVGNRTPYPLRVIVLTRNVPENPSNVPAHWDFAPGEGGSEGLALSVKEREPLLVSPGDIVVAFAIDGSRRYWGPNVVDETLAPFWNSSDRSWTMILQP